MERKEAVIITAGKIDPDGSPAQMANSEFAELVFVDQRAEAMRSAFEHPGFGYEVRRVSGANSASLASLHEHEVPHVGIYHFIGHGVARTKELNIVPATGNFSPSTSLAAFCRHLNAEAESREEASFLVILDLCGAGEGLDSLDPGDSKRLWIACAADGQPVFDGMFSEVWAQLLRDLATGNDIDTGETTAHVSMTALIKEFDKRYSTRLREWAEERGRSTAELPTARYLGRFGTGGEAPPPFFINPHYDRAAALEVKALATIDEPLHPFLDAQHFADRAGVHFTGRASILTDLGKWRAGKLPGSGLHTLTGAAGSGKSALAAAMVLTCHHGILSSGDFGESSWKLLERLPDSCKDSVPGPVAAVHARHRQLGEVTQAFIRQLEGTGSPLLDEGEVETVPELVEWVSHQSEPPLLILDALDEAMNPDELVHLLLRPLVVARRNKRPVCRVLVAGRERVQLVPLEEVAAETRRFDLDEADQSELCGDLEFFLAQVLDRGTACCGWKVPDFAAAVAKILTDREAGREYGAFLVATLYTSYLNRLSHRTTRPDDHLPASPGSADARVPRSLPEVLELDFKRLSPHERRDRRAVMAALAFARGDGMPARLAGVVAKKVFGAGEDLDAVGVLHDSKGIKVYLRSVADPTDEVPLYRLFHQGLNDYLRSQPFGRDGVADGAAV